MAGQQSSTNQSSSGSQSSKSFQFELRPEQQALVDDFMNTNYPNWKEALNSTASSIANINQGAAADWAKQKKMIGDAQVPVNFTAGGAGGGTLATWVPYRASMGNAIDKEAGYRTTAAQAELAPEQAMTDFYSNTVAPFQRQQQASLGNESNQTSSSSSTSESSSYIDLFDPVAGNTVSVPMGDVQGLLSQGWQLGSPDSVAMQGQISNNTLANARKLQKNQIEANEPGLGQQLMGGLSLLKGGMSLYNDPGVQGLVGNIGKLFGGGGGDDLDFSQWVGQDYSGYTGDDWYA